tara:strand:+ start:1066 stop:1932 length:867 start_codon:yes stop_codon:yes gene_type:complete
MPELPEVEVVKKSLEKKICNLIVKDININNINLRYKLKKQELKRLKGKRIVSIERRSKYLLFKFNDNFSLIIHLGMTGKFFFINKKNIKEKTSFYYSLKSKLDKHDHVIFTMNNKSKLIYNDVRKFGFMKVVETDGIDHISHLKDLGPDPFETSFNFRYFKKYLVGRSRLIKDLLMDQKFVSGLGNIYVNEILFSCNILPTRKILNLKDNEIKKIIKFTKKILKMAISYGGSSIKDFAYDNDKSGSFQEKLNVYGKSGQNCSNADCNQKIFKIKLFNRASFFCKRCQI